MDKNETQKVHCNACGHETKHMLLNVRTTENSQFIEGYGDAGWYEKYEMLECCGCESVVLQQTSSADVDDDVLVVHYPPRVSRPGPKWKNDLPRNLSGLLDEIYNALHSDGRRVALMGARAAVDIVMREKVGEDKGSFGKQLEALERLGLIGKKNREYLETALDAGSAAAHRGYLPASAVVNHVMNIVENLLETSYILETSAEQIKKSTPPRKATA